jgi:hypothetical protein
MNYKKIAAITLLFAANTQASQTDFVEMGYTQLSFSDLSKVKARGYVITANKGFESFYLQGSYSSTDDSFSNKYSFNDDFQKGHETIKTTLDFSQASIKLGKIFSLTDSSDIDASVSYNKIKATVAVESQFYYKDNSGYEYDDTYTGKESDSSNAISIEAIHDKRFTNGINTRLGLGVEHLDGSDSDSDSDSETNLTYTAEVGYWFTPNIYTNINYRNANEYTNISANISYNF